MVVYFHTLVQIPQYDALLKRHLLGNAHFANGVDLFFVISGFIMVLTSSRATPGDFAMRRIIRIVPLYWTLTGALLLLSMLRPDVLRTTVASPEYVTKSFFFLPYANPGQHGQLFPLLVPGWSLNLEMFFYAVFTAVLFQPRQRRVIIASVIFLLLVTLAPLFRGTAYGREIGFFGDFRLFEFLFGMVIADWFAARPPSLPTPLSLSIGLTGFVVLLWGLPFLQLTPASWQQVVFENGLPAALIVFAILSLERGLRRHPVPFLAYLGDASYSMYLSHVFLLGAARVLWVKFGLDRVSVPFAILFAVVAMTFSIFGAIVVYRCLELPLLSLLQRSYAQRKFLRKSLPISTGTVGGSGE